MLRVGIIGASGYTGTELARILCNHPEVEISLVTSRQFAGKRFSDVFANLRGRVDLLFENPTPEELVDRADFFFTAVPHKTAMALVPGLLDSGKKVVDLSADFRLRDVATYEKWYDPHSAPNLLSEAVYGLPELNREQIAKARLVANPGCYPTSILLATAPLLKAGAINPTVIADSKSGTSGAGRAAQVGSLFCEVHDGFKPYKVGRSHRHTPEIEQEASLLAGNQINICFTPHLLPISRGILSTIYVEPVAGFDPAITEELYRQAYRDEFFVRYLGSKTCPATQFVRGSNYCDLATAYDPACNRILLMAAIDNIVKGASGQAVQNMNVMCGFAENTGLLTPPTFP